MLMGLKRVGACIKSAAVQTVKVGAAATSQLALLLVDTLDLF